MFKLLLQNFITKNGRSPNAIEMLQLRFKAASQANKGQILPFKQKRDFAAEIKAMMDDGTIKVGQVDKKNDNVLTREMFQNSNLNKVARDRDRAIKAKARIEEKNKEAVTIKSGVSNSQLNKNKAIDQGIEVEPVNEKFIQFTIQDIKKKEPIEGMKIANQIIKREGDFVDLTEEQSKKILTEVNDHIMGVDLPIGPEDLAKGGRAGFYTGGITDVEPSLDDIGHGSDALMARTRLMSPGAQATTSTGLNYLLAEDNDNMRIPFAAGGMGKREFLKLIAKLAGGAAAIKTGILGLGESGAKKTVTETVKQSAGSGMPPPYFFKLVEKIKTMGDDVTVGSATMPRQKVTRYKDYELTEDVATGSKEIKKMGVEDDMITKNEYMTYTKGQADETTKGKKPPDNYEEVTESNSRIIKDEFNDPDYEDGIELKEILEEVGETVTKKADGGRIGYVVGGLSKLGITGSSRKFLEKVFGKEKFKNMIENDPELHRGMLEVAEMFRSKDKAGLVEYMQNFLPQMSKKELEAFVVGSGDTAGIEGQLIRLGSGRDYKNKLEMIEEANNTRKLQNFDIEGVSKNAEGGRIGFSGGGIYRAIIARSAARAGMKPYEYIKKTSYKSLPPEVKMFMSKADFEQLKMGQEQMYSNYIDMAKTRLNFQKEIEGGKKTPARELFEGMEKTMDEQSYVPKNVNEKDIGEMEIMFRNRFLKGRKDNAEGGLQTMLGE